MKSTKFAKIFGLLVLASMLLAACAPAATPTAVVEPTAAAVEPTAAPVEPTTEPTAAATEGTKTLILATTTSTQDSGLLDYLLPMFTQDTGIEVSVIAVGSGQALQMGKDGDADVLLVHSPAAEKTFMDDGDGIRREDVMYNDFVIVGPEADPAKITGMTAAVDAFTAIANAKAPFISRGDESGTNAKELAIWKAAKIEPAGDWYISAGQGMGAVLTMADEQQAYTLSDRATYLAQTQKDLTLKVLVEGDKLLLNPYGVIAVNPAKNAKIQNDLANQFIDWIISVPVQQKIMDFKKAELGQSLFIPQSKLWLESQTAAAPAAALKITGLVETEQAWAEADVKAMTTLEVEAANKDGVMSKYTGVSLKSLLELAKPKADATTVVFVADDGFTAELPLADALACEKCIVSFRDKGGFSTVMPDMANKLNVKGVIEIQVK
ncbi:ABC-type tungstate transport system, permease component [Longilinea arvoryzae]|uniref:ABC-type tungstate transport system, permease component n=1 Tax=Longilinea arvoryzae TaxID=360412 RepID=A0A0S7B6F2_9CHLR|nr:substrate-binding domain-containing protein [Longilinea arvoryzae]GAP12583.1 ABC-type tungstate transport system, permease component [Longilinea arvoryzae]